jgi:hypothetical protein
MVNLERSSCTERRVHANRGESMVEESMGEDGRFIGCEGRSTQID